MALKDFYEEVGANVKAIQAADNDIPELFYADEKKPYMWWGKFDIRLTNSFAIVDNDAGRQVRTDTLNLGLLNKNIRADFLTTMKTTIEIQMSITPITTTYSSVIVNYRNTVNQRFPNESSVKRDNRRIQITALWWHRSKRRPWPSWLWWKGRSRGPIQGYHKDK